MLRFIIFTNRVYVGSQINPKYVKQNVFVNITLLTLETESKKNKYINNK